MYNPHDLFIIDDSGSMRDRTATTTALIDGVEVEYDGMSNFYTQSEINFYSKEFGWEYLGKGFTHTHHNVLVKTPEAGYFWKRV